MEAIRKQASKLREQVAKQQQALLRQLGHFGTETILADEAEAQCHQQLQDLYNSTRSAKHFQKNIVRGIGGFISLSSKQMAIVRRLADDCSKYGGNNQNSGFTLATAAPHFSTTHNSIEDERETLLGILGDQVCEPLRAQITGAPLEDARHLTHRYDKLRQEVEIQAAEVLKRQSKSRDSSISVESATRLQNAEARLSELKSTMTALGREAIAAMQSVEGQQQQVTYQRLLTMVDAERSYHQSALTNLERLNDEVCYFPQWLCCYLWWKCTTFYASYIFLHSDRILFTLSNFLFHIYMRNIMTAWFLPLFIIGGQLVLLTQSNKALPQSTNKNGEEHGEPFESKDTKLVEADAHVAIHENNNHSIAKVIHPFDAQAEGELSLSVDDYVVLRQVSTNGWSEGECKGKSGWFPSAYVERQEKVAVSKLNQVQIQSTPQSLPPS